MHTNFAELTLSQMVSTWNDLIPAATAAGLDV